MWKTLLLASSSSSAGASEEDETTDAQLDAELNRQLGEISEIYGGDDDDIDDDAEVSPTTIGEPGDQPARDSYSREYASRNDSRHILSAITTASEATNTAPKLLEQRAAWHELVKSTHRQTSQLQSLEARLQLSHLQPSNAGSTPNTKPVKAAGVRAENSNTDERTISETSSGGDLHDILKSLSSFEEALTAKIKETTTTQATKALCLETRRVNNQSQQPPVAAVLVAKELDRRQAVQLKAVAESPDDELALSSRAATSPCKMSSKLSQVACVEASQENPPMDAALVGVDSPASKVNSASDTESCRAVTVVEALAHDTTEVSGNEPGKQISMQDNLNAPAVGPQQLIAPRASDPSNVELDSPTSARLRDTPTDGDLLLQQPKAKDEGEDEIDTEPAAASCVSLTSEAACIIIQHAGRRRIRHHMRQTAAASLQRAVRGWLAKKRLAHLIRTRERKISMAVFIQARARAQLCRKYLERKQVGALVIQCYLRRRSAVLAMTTRKHFARGCAIVRLTVARARMNQLIRCWIRGFRASKTILLAAEQARATQRAKQAKELAMKVQQANRAASAMKAKEQEQEAQARREAVRLLKERRRQRELAQQAAQVDEEHRRVQASREAESKRRELERREQLRRKEVESKKAIEMHKRNEALQRQQEEMLLECNQMRLEDVHSRRVERWLREADRNMRASVLQCANEAAARARMRRDEHALHRNLVRAIHGELRLLWGYESTAIVVQSWYRCWKERNKYVKYRAQVNQRLQQSNRRQVQGLVAGDGTRISNDYRSPPPRVGQSVTQRGISEAPEAPARDKARVPMGVSRATKMDIGTNLRSNSSVTAANTGQVIDLLGTAPLWTSAESDVSTRVEDGVTTSTPGSSIYSPAPSLENTPREERQHAVMAEWGFTNSRTAQLMLRRRAMYLGHVKRDNHGGARGATVRPVSYIPSATRGGKGKGRRKGANNVRPTKRRGVVKRGVQVHPVTQSAIRFS